MNEFINCYCSLSQVYYLLFPLGVYAPRFVSPRSWMGFCSSAHSISRCNPKAPDHPSQTSIQNPRLSPPKNRPSLTYWAFFRHVWWWLYVYDTVRAISSHTVPSLPLPAEQQLSRTIWFTPVAPVLRKFLSKSPACCIAFPEMFAHTINEHGLSTGTGSFKRWSDLALTHWSSPLHTVRGYLGRK